MYNLLLKGGTVLDPSRDVHERLDVAITADKISSLAPTIAPTEADRVVDVEGKFITPGLIDIHTHVYYPGRGLEQPDPDIAGVRGGVTTVADAGTPGPSNFQEFRDFVSTQAQTSVYSFLSIFRDRSHPSMTDESELDVKGVVRVAQQNPVLVKGVKALVYPGTVRAMGLKHVEAAKNAARQAGIRIYLHIGDVGFKGQTPTPLEVVRQAISMLEPGDILTHVFSPLTGAAMDREGRLLPELKEAQDRGVVLDPSCGEDSFGWERADGVMSQGVIPDTIGTDIQPGAGKRRPYARGLLEYSAFFMSLDFSLDDVIRMTTINPARALGIDDWAGSLAVGRTADITVLEVAEGRWRLTDSTGASRIGSTALLPVLTIKGGELIEPGEPLHPWGWGPPTEVETAANGDHLRQSDV